MVAREVYSLDVSIWDDDDVVGPTVYRNDVVLIRARPLTVQRVLRKIDAKGVFPSRGPTFSAYWPSVNFIATGHDAVITSGGEYVCIGRWQGYFVFRKIRGSGHRNLRPLRLWSVWSSQPARFLARPYINPNIPVAYISSPLTSSRTCGRLSVAWPAMTIPCLIKSKVVKCNGQGPIALCSFL